MDEKINRRLYAPSNAECAMGLLKSVVPDAPRTIQGVEHNVHVRGDNRIEYTNGALLVEMSNPPVETEPDDQYPDTALVWPAGEPALEVSVDLQYLAALNQHLRAIGGDSKVVLRLHGGINGIEIVPAMPEGPAFDLHWRALLMPLRIEDESMAMIVEGYPYGARHDVEKSAP